VRVEIQGTIGEWKRNLRIESGHRQAGKLGAAVRVSPERLSRAEGKIRDAAEWGGGRDRPP
jgi:hypothetical protein